MKTLRALLGGLSVLILASCATVPERPTAQWLGVLPEGSSLYISFAVQPSVGMIKKALDGAGPDYADVKTLVDMTRRVFVAVTLAPQKAPRFSAIALGGYPSAFIGMSLGGRKEWKSKRSPAGSWFESSKSGLQVSIPADSVVLVSNGDVESLLLRLRGSAALAVPPEVARDMEKSDAVFYLPELPEGLTERASENIRIPIREVWLDARKGQGSYMLGGTVNLTSEKEARLFTLILKLALVTWLRSQDIPDAAERLKPVTVTPQGSQVTMSGLAFTEDEILPFFLSLIRGLSEKAEPAGKSP